MNNTIKINFSPDQDYIWGIEGLEQWDKCQKLEISGIDISDEIVEVHFSLQEFQGIAKRMLGIVKDGVVYADIPAFVLEGPDYICSDADVYSAYAWVYLSDEESAETLRKMEFEIKARPKPDEYVSPDEQDAFLKQIKQVMADTKEIAQSVRNDADNGKFNGKDGVDGQDGMDGKDGKDGVDGKDGADGQDGIDGKSAYQYAQEGGYTGTEEEFKTSIANVSYPKKVFEYEWKDNFDKINVTAIDFENGILTVDTMPTQITDDVSTTARLFPTLFIEGVVQPFKYGFIPQEILTRAENLYYAVKVGDSQIRLYSGTNAIDSLTDSGNIDLTRWGFQVEKSRNQFMGNLDVANLESTHRYKAYYYIPYSASKTAGVRFNSPNGSFGKGHGNGYASTLIGVQKANTIYTPEFNQYETFSLRGIYYNFTYEYNYYPKIFEVDVRKVGNVYKADCTANYFYEIGTKNANTVFNMHTLHSNVFLQNPFSSIAFIGGNGNYIPDGSRCELWDYGEVF